MKITALCDFPYWEGNLGTAVRYESLCQSLVRIADLTVVCTQPLPTHYQTFAASRPYSLIDRQMLEDIDARLVLPDLPAEHDDRKVVLRAIRHLVETGGCDAVLTPYLNRDWLTRHLDRSILRVVDTYDCQSQRTRSFLRHGMLPTFTMTPEQEGRQLDTYDLVLAMSDEDQAEFAAMTRTPVVTAPFRLPERGLYEPTPQGRSLLFVAARSPINDLTLAYLLDQILPLVPFELTLHVVGNVTVPHNLPRNLRLLCHEGVEDISYVYGQVDLALNPVYAGGGVKTKTLEALSFGVPILTSDEGARGLRGLIPEELIVNDKESFAWRITRLLEDPPHRAALSREIIARLRAENADGWMRPFTRMIRVLQEARHP